MKKLLFLLLPILICSCATLGTKTLYKINEKPSIKQFSIIKPEGDSILNMIYPKTSEIFRSTVIEMLKEYGINSTSDYNAEISYYNPDINMIKDICRRFNSDAILLTKLKFIHVTYSMYLIPIMENYDTDVEMKLLDYSGRLLYSTSHNTYRGNSYFNAPTPDITVHDGIEGALKRILKEMGLKKNK